MERYNQQILWNLRIKVKHRLKDVLFFLQSLVQNDLIVDYKCLMSRASVGSIGTLKITQADGYCSMNDLEPN